MELGNIYAAVSIWIAAMSFCTAAHAGAYSDPELGYSLTLPDDWVAISKPAVARLRDEMMSSRSGSTWNYCAAFQPASHTHDFQYPYIIVQNTPYPGGKQIDTITEVELKHAVAKMSGVSPGDLQKALSSKARDRISGPITVPIGTYITQPPGFRMEFNLTIANVGLVHGQSFAVLGKSRTIIAHCYAQQSEWDTFQPAFESIGQSLRMSPEQQPALGSSNPLGAFDWSTVKQSATIGALVGVSAGTFIWLLKRVKKKST